MQTQTRMPGVIESYFEASNANDIHALAACFAAEATVADEKHTYRGTGEIKAWAVDVRKKYAFTTEVLHAVEKAGATVVTAKVSGTFPGSPVNLDFRFVVKGERIGELEIG
jgi:hypothetical protein